MTEPKHGTNFDTGLLIVIVAVGAILLTASIYGLWLGGIWGLLSCFLYVVVISGISHQRGKAKGFVQAMAAKQMEMGD